MKDLRQLERADLRRRAKAARDEARAVLRAERRERRREVWPKWVAFWERVAGYLKTAATVTTSLAAIGAFVWRVTLFYRARGVPPALPPPNGGDRLAVDRVEHPGSPRPESPTSKD